MARIPRLFARRARSIASIERGTPSGSEWACISIAPARVCAIAGIAISANREGEISHGIFITLEDYCRLSIFPHEGGRMKKFAIAIPLLGIISISAAWAQGGDPNYKPKRLNKAIELLEDGQPIYNASAQGGDGYDAGLKLSHTYNDFIIYEMEHGTFDVASLRQFMLGLAKGGPTKSGHRTPPVIVTLPILGYDEVSIRA